MCISGHGLVTGRPWNGEVSALVPKGIVCPCGASRAAEPGSRCTQGSQPFQSYSGRKQLPAHISAQAWAGVLPPPECCLCFDQWSYLRNLGSFIVTSTCSGTLIRPPALSMLWLQILVSAFSKLGMMRDTIMKRILSFSRSMSVPRWSSTTRQARKSHLGVTSSSFCLS